MVKTFSKILVGFLLVAVSASAFAQLKLPKLGKKKEKTEETQTQTKAAVTVKKLTNNDVLDMWKKGVDTTVIVSTIVSATAHDFMCDFNTVYEYVKLGVPVQITEALYKKANGMESTRQASEASVTRSFEPSSSVPAPSQAPPQNTSTSPTLTGQASTASVSSAVWVARGKSGIVKLAVEPANIVEASGLKALGGAVGLNQHATLHIEGLRSPSNLDVNSMIEVSLSGGSPYDFTILKLKQDKNKRSAATQTMGIAAGVKTAKGEKVAWQEVGNKFQFLLSQLQPGEYAIVDLRSYGANVRSAVTFSMK